ncbi:hypothetical protein [Streptomyces sp. NPDC006527]|uniref:hypothetical protein n=1 Tax=Streptomyces sp. NPDC006527 TaxID=3364749 RepID=UPI00367DC9AC
MAVDAAAAKQLSFTVHSRQADSVGAPIQVAEAALKLEAARLHTYRAVAEVDQAAASGGPLDYAARTHVRLGPASPHSKYSTRSARC